MGRGEGGEGRRGNEGEDGRGMNEVKVEVWGV